jgi:molecular chaperone GrpE
LLNFLDYFEQARRQLRDPAAAEGLEIMARQFNELLQKHGVKPVECIGLPFDPETQEGIGYVETDEYPEGCVAEEICCGYMLDNILLKPAQVMVQKKS